MNLVTLNANAIQLGEPLPFALRNSSGLVLAPKGYVFQSRAELDELEAKGVTLCIDSEESAESVRLYRAELDRMMRSAETSLADIAALTIKKSDKPAPVNEARDTRPGFPDWTSMQVRATKLLRAPEHHDFIEQFSALHQELLRACIQAPDATTLALIFLSAKETRMYSATHAMLVSCVCMMASHETLRWPKEKVVQVGRAALSMNIAMTELQDQLVNQAKPLTETQAAAVESHSERSASLLRDLGVQDPVWLDAVRIHHHRMPGELASKTDSQQMARLIQRADVFAARLAPRIARSPMPVTAAMQASYYDETKQVDQAGAAIVKTLGIYPPGSFVRLASQEIAIVLRRGASANTPQVAVVVNREGMPTGELIRRDTMNATWKIAGVVAQKDLRVQISLERLLAQV